MKSNLAYAVLLCIIASGCVKDGDFAQSAAVLSQDPGPVPSESPLAAPLATPVPSESPTPAPTVSQTPIINPSPSPTPYVFQGNGTQGDPYLLVTASDVQHIDDHLNAYFSLTHNINMAGVAFRPLGIFSGVLYGNNYSLDSLTIHVTDGSVAALFQGLTGTLVLLKMNVDIRSNGYATGFAGTVYGFGAFISSCQISGTMVSGLGGNGYNSGIGNGIYVSKDSNSRVVNTQEITLIFNGNRVSTSTFLN